MSLILGGSMVFGSTLLGCHAFSGSGWRSAEQPQAGPQDLPPPAEANEKAPDKFQVEFETTKGNFVVEVNREWSPNGADRFYNLVKIGYFQDIAYFRAIEGFMIQFGIHGDPQVNKVWSEARIKDDPNAGISNEPGMLTFAKTGAPDSRSVQFFINLGNNARLDEMGFTPLGKVVSGMDVVKQINTEYGENSREVQGRFQAEGNKFIREKYPNIDFIKSAKLITKE
jgi:peptidyl-prolyl cis-trans isomerase A (cyclophilin A)